MYCECCVHFFHVGSHSIIVSFEYGNVCLSEFTSGNEYVYNYESQVLTGIPPLSKQYSGIKIVSKAKIAFGSASDATLQVCLLLDNRKK